MSEMIKKARLGRSVALSNRDPLALSAERPVPLWKQRMQNGKCEYYVRKDVDSEKSSRVFGSDAIRVAV